MAVPGGVAALTETEEERETQLQRPPGLSLMCLSIAQEKSSIYLFIYLFVSFRRFYVNILRVK